MSNIRLLPLLGSTAEQQDQLTAILTEIHAITWPEIDTPFGNAFTDRLGVSTMSGRHTIDCSRHSGSGDRIQAVEPGRERTRPVWPLVVGDFAHWPIVTHALSMATGKILDSAPECFLKQSAG